MAAGKMQEIGVIGSLASAVGAPEPALRLLLSILIGYPLAVLHRYTLFGKSPNLQHGLFIVGGLGVGYFNYGWDVLHSATTVLVVYLILAVAGGTVLSVVLVFAFTMGYLLTGYAMTGTETYDIKWSMPQCVLTLRLIGLAYDVLDGKKPPEELSDEQRKTALPVLPSLLEVAAHTYFPSSFLVGPQFPMRRYQKFVAGEYRDSDSELPACVFPGLRRGALGFLYLGLFQVGTTYFPDSFLLSPEYDRLPWVSKCLILGFWAKITLYKYISCWLISEGVCIATGLTHNGKATDGSTRWDGCANVRLRVYEGATRFEHYIASFNINTNQWVAQYVYKRLKFLGNRYVSQGAALIFLAIWHGLHSGYYMCFFMEFLVVKLEKDVEKMLSKNPKISSMLDDPTIRPFLWVLLKLYTFVFMGYCLAPFVLLSFSRWWQVYRSVYYIGFTFFLAWPIYRPFVAWALRPAPEPLHLD